MALDYSFILRLVDKMSGPSKKAAKSVKDIGASATATAAKMGKASKPAQRFFKKLTHHADGTAKSMEHLERTQRRNKMLFYRRSMQAASISTKKFLRGIASVPRRLKLVERAGWAAGRGIKWAGGKMLGFAKTALKAGAAAAGAFGGFAAFDFLRQNSKFEQYEISLKKIEGSAEKARERLLWLESLKLPVPIADLTASYIELRKKGINPTISQMRHMTAEVIANKREMEDIAEAITDAKNGKFDGLGAFDIAASTKKAGVFFSYIDDEGKRITRRSKDDAKSIEDAIIGIFGERSSASLEEYSASFSGMMQSMRNHWVSFELRIGRAGIYDKIKAKIQSVLDKIAKWSEDGTLQRWAEEISAKMEQAIDWAEKFIEETDWQKVERDIRNIAEALVMVANAIIKISENARSAFNFSPAGALYNIYDYFAGDAAPAPKAAPKKKKPMTPAQRTRWNKAMEGEPSWLQKPAAPRGGALPAQDVKVSGKTEVEIGLSPGLIGKINRIDKSNSDIDMVARLMKTGAAMVSPV